MDLLNFSSPRPQRRWQSDRAFAVVDCSYYIANKKRGVKKKKSVGSTIDKICEGRKFPSVHKAETNAIPLRTFSPGKYDSARRLSKNVPLFVRFFSATPYPRLACSGTYFKKAV